MYDLSKLMSTFSWFFSKNMGVKTGEQRGKIQVFVFKNVYSATRDILTTKMGKSTAPAAHWHSDRDYITKDGQNHKIQAKPEKYGQFPQILKTLM